MSTPFEHPFLRELGRHVRRSREERELALAELARSAGVSRRYLTDLESGRGNPSVLLLLRIANALHTRVAALTDVALRPRAARRVALLGLRGAGKSTVGRALARRLEVPLVELDRRVEKAAGFQLGEIFDLHGSTGFKHFEGEALERVLCEGEALVLATGGSIVDHGRNFERLLETCRTVWLKARPEEHFGRVLGQGDPRPISGRPRAIEELLALLRRREPLYAKSELIVDTHGRTPEQVVQGIVSGLQLET